MASIKDLKKRIVSTKSTQQTTKAMKMVSAAKLRRAQEAIQNNRPYAKRLDALIRRLSTLPGVNVKSPFFRREASDGETQGKRLLLVVVTSDRGLCGGFNGNVIKGAQRWMAANEENYSKVTLAFVGRRGHDFFKTRKVNRGPYWAEVGGKVTFAKAKILAKALTEGYLSGEYDEVKVIYNEFKNAVTQIVQVDSFLPLEPQAAAADGADAMVIAKPSAEALLAELLGKTFAIQAFRILLDSQASEHGARMSAMENATKNAGEMIKGLTLQYNKQRQAGITKELLEIIAGSESQKVEA